VGAWFGPALLAIILVMLVAASGAPSLALPDLTIAATAPSRSPTPTPEPSATRDRSDDGTATLIAAIVAAIAALASVITTAVVGRRGEGREVHRDLLKDHLAELGEAIHEVVATSSTQHKKLEEQRERLTRLEAARHDSAAAELTRVEARSPDADKAARVARRRVHDLESAVAASATATDVWRRRGQHAAGELEALRRKLRYPLEGFDAGMRALTRVPSWIGHRLGSDEGAAVLDAANEVAQALHRGIAYSWRAGRPPRKRHVRALTTTVNKLRQCAPIGEPES
jgi:hypothetical protein